MQAVPGAFLQIITLKTSAKQESKQKRTQSHVQNFHPRVNAIGPLGAMTCEEPLHTMCPLPLIVHIRLPEALES